MTLSHPILSHAPAAPPPIFIGGHHRSGTTLMRRLLARHPHIACGPESNLLRDNKLARIHEFLRNDWAAGLDPRYGFDPATVDAVLAELINAVIMPYAQARRKQRWAEKTPKNIVFIDMLFALFPTAQFIHMIRDPRDVYCSVREKAARTTPRWADTTPEQVASEWCRRIASGVPWRDRPERYQEVRYDVLVTQPEATMRSLLAYLNEPWSPKVLEGQTIFGSSVGRWRRELSAAEAGAIEMVAGPTMAQFDYAPSTTETAAYSSIASS